MAIPGDARCPLLESLREPVAFALGERAGGAEAGGAQRARSGVRVRRRLSAAKPCPDSPAQTSFNNEDPSSRAQDAMTLAQHRDSRGVLEWRECAGRSVQDDRVEGTTREWQRVERRHLHVDEDADRRRCGRAPSVILETTATNTLSANREPAKLAA